MTMNFTAQQEAELELAANAVLESNKWDGLPWGDAWNGAYPVKPSRAEIERTVENLKEAFAAIIGRMAAWNASGKCAFTLKPANL